MTREGGERGKTWAGPAATGEAAEGRAAGSGGGRGRRCSRPGAGTLPCGHPQGAAAAASRSDLPSRGTASARPAACRRVAPETSAAGPAAAESLRAGGVCRGEGRYGRAARSPLEKLYGVDSTVLEAFSTLVNVVILRRERTALPVLTGGSGAPTCTSLSLCPRRGGRLARTHPLQTALNCTELPPKAPPSTRSPEAQCAGALL